MGLIQDALFDFDKAAIFTIHGFCQRVLHENAFETRSLFDTELVADPTVLTQEIADDFWRKQLYTMPPEFISYALKKISGPDFFLKLLAQKKTPEIKIIPNIGQPALKSLPAFRKLYKKLKNLWPASRTAVIQLLQTPALSGTIYGSLTTKAKQGGVSNRDLKISAMVAAMDRFVDTKLAGFPLFNKFEHYTAAKISKATRKKESVPSHEIFDICEALYQNGLALESEMEKYLLFLKSECFKFAETELAAKKKVANIQFFDDLLLMVTKALESKGGNILAGAIRDKYKAALVDEFQDTDAVQYAIFSKLFSSKESILFMIGDPKQSIYSFRGADVFSYMQAARHADLKYTLIENWRSSPGLISAINTIFSNVNKPFIFNEIPFTEGISAGKNDTVIEQAPLKLWYLEFEKATSMSKAAAVQLIAAAVTGEISRLISNDMTKDADFKIDCITPGDIAVLVRTNRQAQIIKAHLSSRKIPSVLFSAGNIFHSHEAREMERILSSISEPANERLFRAALATDMMGVAGQDFDLQSQEPSWWQERFGAFREYFQLWRQYGLIRMFSRFMAKEAVRGRLLSFADGERRLTNVLHLIEVLYQESAAKNLGTTGLVRWLSEQIQTTSFQSETHQLRLESDEHAVKIITVHKSKGLEYQIVFCPFGWEGSTIKNKEIVFHDNTENCNIVLDLDAGQNSLHIVRAQNELLAENLRLLYVALTRAKKRCYLAWGCFKAAQTSALAFLFHSDLTLADDISSTDVVAALRTDISKRKSKDFLADLKHLANRSEGTIELIPMPVESNGDYHHSETFEKNHYCRQFAGKMDTAWKVASYSYLISKKILDEALPDRDAFHELNQNLADRRQDVSEIADIYSFPKGTRAGIFFHDLFENLDFLSKDQEHTDILVTDKLRTYGFGIKWQASISTMLQKVLAAPLTSDPAPLTLAWVKPEDRINEMEFYFPLNPITPQKLKNIFENHSDAHISENFPRRVETLSFSMAKGFMKGYIDLIIHAEGRYFMVDWKSNYLGSRLEDYNQAALVQTMNADFYILQYHLYTLALHQYLKMRVPGYRYERDFGGVIYIFIRGVDPDRGSDFGIYKDLPNPEIVRALGSTLIPNFSL